MDKTEQTKIIKALDFVNNKIEGCNDFESALIRLINTVRDHIENNTVSTMSKRELENIWENQPDNEEEEDW